MVEGLVITHTIEYPPELRTWPNSVLSALGAWFAQSKCIVDFSHEHFPISCSRYQVYESSELDDHRQSPLSLDSHHNGRG